MGVSALDSTRGDIDTITTTLRKSLAEVKEEKARKSGGVFNGIGSAVVSASASGR